MSWMDELRAKLIAQRLYASDAMRAFAQKVFMFGASALIGVASIKITVALSTGHEKIVFLVLLTAVATFLLWRVTSSFKEAPNARGAQYLESLKLAYRGKLDATIAEGSASGAAHVFDAGSLFLVGLFGFSALSGTAEQQLAEVFQKGASGDGGCGGGCGGDGGGGGCGGGCGGCGGCGG